MVCGRIAALGRTLPPATAWPIGICQPFPTMLYSPYRTARKEAHRTMAQVYTIASAVQFSARLVPEEVGASS